MELKWQKRKSSPKKKEKSQKRPGNSKFIINYNFNTKGVDKADGYANSRCFMRKSCKSRVKKARDSV